MPGLPGFYICKGCGASINSERDKGFHFKPIDPGPYCSLCTCRKHETA